MRWCCCNCNGRCCCAAVLPFAKRGDDRSNNLVRLQQLFPRIVAADYEQPRRVSDDCRALLRSMLTPDPNKRITIPDIMQHPWCPPAAHPGSLVPPLLVAGSFRVQCICLLQVTSVKVIVAHRFLNNLAPGNRELNDRLVRRGVPSSMQTVDEIESIVAQATTSGGRPAWAADDWCALPSA